MWLLPLAAAGVALAFAVALVRKQRTHRRTHEILWAIALVLYAVASLALALGVVNGWSELEYRLYWGLGAVLNVPFLAAGELTLLFRQPWVRWSCIFVLVFCCAYTVAVLQDAEMSPTALTEDLPSGKDVFGDASPAHRLPQLFSYPAYFILLGGALWSAWRMRGRPELRPRFVGTLLIALGATVVAAGSGFAAAGVLAGFSATLAAGIVLMYLGFIRASRAARVVAPS